MTKADIHSLTVEFMRRMEASERVAAPDANFNGEAEPASLTSSWPEPLRIEAYHGIAGEFVRLLEPNTEADPAALLTQFLAYAGNAIGRGPHFRAEADRHFTNINLVVVGQTAKGRKGTSEAWVRRLLREVDSHWASRRIKTGLSSGEGLIFEVRDRKDGGKEPDPGEPDKRLLVIEPEFASVLSVCERPGNTLSPVLRRAWDAPELLSPMTKTSRVEASNPHISIVGHITRDELRRLLTDTAAGNGFANRFLWVCARRAKLLPEGGRLHETELVPLAEQLRCAVDHARVNVELRRDEAARAMWRQVYPDLSEGRPGLLGAVTSRAEAQTMRLALIYALLDGSDAIRANHLAAGIEVWRYAMDSARFIFGDTLGDATADQILRALRVAPNGMTRTEIRDHFQRNKHDADISRALDVLAEYGLAFSRREQRDRGRPTERWFATATLTTETMKTTEVGK